MESHGSDVVQPQDPGRADFLRTLGLAGLGVLGAGAMLSRPAQAEEGKQPRYVFVVTNGGNNPNRAIWSLLIADVALKKEMGSVHVWFTIEGADLCLKGHAEKVTSPIFLKYGNALEIMEGVRKQGGTFGCRLPCAEYYGAKDSNKLEFVEMQGGDWLAKNIVGATVLWM
jgi:predicted peroxiredoxin